MNRLGEKACAWSAIGFCVLFGVGMALLARFVPPTSPDLNALQVAELYENNRNMIRTGALVMFIGNGFYLPFTAVIGLLMWRAGHHIWAFVQLLGGGVGAMAPFVSTMFWSAAAFRPDRDPQIVLALNDVAWFFAIMFFVPVFTQYISVGIVGLTAKEGFAPWTRSIGYLSIWLAIMQMPAGILTYFKDGPFAWDGLFGFWIPAGAFFSWMLIMVNVLLRAIEGQSRLRDGTGAVGGE